MARSDTARKGFRALAHGLNLRCRVAASPSQFDQMEGSLPEGTTVVLESEDFVAVLYRIAGVPLPIPTAARRTKRRRDSLYFLAGSKTRV
jgi:hypothetical protein